MFRPTRLIEEARAAAAKSPGAGNPEGHRRRRTDHRQSTEAAEAELRAHDRPNCASEVGRLVVQTTAKVTGKVLTPEDQKRLAEETTQAVGRVIAALTNRIMKISKQARREAKALFRSCMVERRARREQGAPGRRRRLLRAKPRGYLAILSHFQRLVKLDIDRRTAPGRKRGRRS